MTQSSLENRLEALAAEMEQVKEKLGRLETWIASDAVPPALRQAEARPIAATGKQPAPAEESPGEEFWPRLGRASLLPRIAAISFALVIALLLRTLTDNHLIAPQTGSSLGLGYAALLIGLGWWLYGRHSRLAPVFPVCGAMLLFLVVLEAHARFDALSSPAAYLILLATLLALVLLASRYRFPFLATLGLLGAGITGLVIDFPDPSFPLLAFFLLMANATAYLVANRPPGKETARWGLFLLTVMLWLTWVVKLLVPLEQGLPPASQLGFSWFTPCLVLYLLLFTMMTLHRTFRLKRFSALDICLPTMSALLFYPAVRAVAVPLPGPATWVGAAGLGWSALLLLAAVLGVATSRESSKAACVFTFAGSALLLLAIPDLTSSLLLALPVWSVGALFLLKLSGHCEIGGIRLSSYLLQVTACVAGIVSGSFSTQTPHLPLSLAVVGGLTVLSGFHYRLSRRNPLSCSAGFFATIDPGDRTAMALLLVTVANGFAALHLGAALVLAGTAVDFGTALTGVQSVILNGGAFGLMVLGLKSHNKELLAVALAVFIGGAVKVFGYDLFEMRGIPLMVSVFSFGAAAALGSVVLGRWQHTLKQPV